MTPCLQILKKLLGLLGHWQATPKILCSVLDHAIEEKCGQAGEGHDKKGHDGPDFMNTSKSLKGLILPLKLLLPS